MIDANPTSGAARTRRWFRRPWALIAVAVLLIVGGVWANHLHERAKGRREIEKRLDVLRSMGVAVTPAELAVKYPDPPPEKDAERILQPRLDRLKEPPYGSQIPIFEVALPSRLQPLPETGRIESLQFLESQAAILSPIPPKQLNGAWFGAGYPRSVTNLGSLNRKLPHNLTKAFLLKAIISIESGNTEEAVTSLVSASQVAGAFRSELFLDHLRFRHSQLQSVFLLERLINRSRLTESELSTVSKLCSQQKERINGFRAAFDILIVDGLISLEEVRKSPADLAFRAVPESGSWASKARATLESTIKAIQQKTYEDSDYVDFLDLAARQVRALETGSTSALRELEEIESAVRKALPTRSAAYRLLIPRTAGIAGRAAWDLEIPARLRTARTGFAVERYRLAHAGSLPESLADLVPAYLPEVPPDLFDGQPLRYRKLPKGYVVYSIGRDLTNDGGKEPPVDPKPDDRHDITFTVERPD